MRFDAFELSLHTIRILRTLHARIRTRDPKLATQLRDAATSASFNIAEGYLHPKDITEAEDKTDHLSAIIYKLTR